MGLSRARLAKTISAMPTTAPTSDDNNIIVGISLIVFAKRARDKAIPFGPYLAAAGLLTMLYGAQLGGFTAGLFG